MGIGRKRVRGNLRLKALNEGQPERLPVGLPARMMMGDGFKEADDWTEVS
jgi:hypothetical protein